MCLLAGLLLFDELEVWVESSRVVREFSGVFLFELTGLSPVQEIDIYVDLVLDLCSILMSLYRFTLVELEEYRKAVDGVVVYGLR